MKVLNVNVINKNQEGTKLLRIVCNEGIYNSSVNNVIDDLKKINKDIDFLMSIRPDIDTTILCCVMLKYSTITIRSGRISSIKLGRSANGILARSLKR